MPGLGHVISLYGSQTCSRIVENKYCFRSCVRPPAAITGGSEDLRMVGCMGRRICTYFMFFCIAALLHKYIPWKFWAESKMLQWPDSSDWFKTLIKKRHPVIPLKRRARRGWFLVKLRYIHRCRVLHNFLQLLQCHNLIAYTFVLLVQSIHLQDNGCAQLSWNWVEYLHVVLPYISKQGSPLLNDFCSDLHSYQRVGRLSM